MLNPNTQARPTFTRSHIHNRTTYAIGTWRNPGAPGAYALAPPRGIALHVGSKKRGGGKKG